jgi:hypothetical protein
MLVQAAQHAGRHPGPLGHFFRKLAKKKNRNVAVVATARKLMMIAWQMLTKREPYRYAQPAVTERKLQKLRVRATGQKRKAGPKTGSANEPKLGVGVKSRTIPALAEVLAAEALPTPTAPPPGEARTIEQAGCAEYVNSLTQPQVKARSSKQADVA